MADVTITHTPAAGAAPVFAGDDDDPRCGCGVARSGEIARKLPTQNA